MAKWVLEIELQSLTEDRQIADVLDLVSKQYRKNGIHEAGIFMSRQSAFSVDGLEGVTRVEE